MDKEEFFYNAVVQIGCLELNRGGEFAFTHYDAGIIVDNSSVLTCSHVVSQALGLGDNIPASNLPNDAVLYVRRIFVDGYNSRPRAAKIKSFNQRIPSDPISDITILEMVSEDRFDVAGRQEIAKFKIVDCADSQRISAWGFPEDADNIIEQAVPAFYVVQSIAPSGWIFAVGDPGHGQEIRKGFSGAPVMERISGNIIGMVCEADTHRRTVSIISAYILAKIRPIQIALETKTNHQEVVVPVMRLKVNRFRLFLDQLFPRIHYFLTVRFPILPDPQERTIVQADLRHNLATWIYDINEKTYLPPPAKEIGGPSFELQRPDNSFLLPIQQLIKEIAGVSSGGDASSAQISALSKRSRNVRNMVRRLLHSERPMIVLGDPGSGKTLTLRQTAIEVASRNIKRVFPNVCVFISLGRWLPVKNPDIVHVEELVYENVPSSIRPIFNQLIEQKRVILIFDGLDEMSRENYIEHTQVLSKFADKYRGIIRTLFSCRITDFSPAFRHHRLILMPFNRKHIRQYLSRQFGALPVSVAGSEMSISQLAKKLYYSNLPIQPQNPFSLWLLCLYIREKKIWPESRVELLTFSFEYQYRQKSILGTIDGEIFPPISEMFNAWSKLAFEITSLNRGSDIAWPVMRGIFGGSANQILAVGRTCGVLQQTTDVDPIRVRFIHHRAQEFFAAYYLSQNKIDIDWGKYLDIPRWQETLVFVTQMKTGTAPLIELITGLDKIKKVYDRHIQWGPPATAEEQSLLAERIEFSSRIAQVTSHVIGFNGFLDKLKSSIVTMASYGNPISRVKMLNAVQLLPFAGLGALVRRMQTSRIKWVRQKAEDVSTVLAGKPVNGTDPQDMAGRYSNGQIFISLGRRLQLCKEVGEWGAYFMNLALVLIFFIQTVAMAAVIPTATKVINPLLAEICSRKVDSKINFVSLPRAEKLEQVQDSKEANVYFQKWQVWIVSCISGLLMIWALIFYPRDAWLISIVGGSLILILSSIVFVLWVTAPVISYRILLALTIDGIILFVVTFLFWVFVVILIEIFIWGCITLLLSCAIRIGAKGEIDIRATFRNLWRLSRFRQWLNDYRPILGHLFAIGVAGGISFFNLFYPRDEWIGGLPYLPLFGTILVVEYGCYMAYLFMFSIILHVKKREQAEIFEKRNTAITVLVSVAFMYPLFALLNAFGKAVDEYYLQISDASATKLVMTIIPLITIFTAMGVSFYAYLLLRFLMKGFVIPQFVPSTTHGFKRAMEKASPYKQAYLLNSLTPDLLKLDSEQFYNFLTDIEDFIDDEPASSKYYSKLAELQELMKQSRSG